MSEIPVQYHDLFSLAYKEVWDFQMLVHEDIKRHKKIVLRDKNTSSSINHLIFCEHKPVYTLGKSADPSNLNKPKETLVAQGFEVHAINRGGDVTYHGPGQITGYLILDLELLYRDVHRYVRNLELAVILLLADYGIKAGRVEGLSGVWITKKDTYVKICAIGVHLSRWVSMHGFGFNVNSDLAHFSNIIPCGIDASDKSVTSLAAELGEEQDMEMVKIRLKEKFSQVFGLRYVNEKNK